MSRSAFQLTSEERAELEAALHKTHHAGTWRRLRALLLLAEGQRVSEVARLLGVHRQAIHRWRTLYEQDHSPDSLQEHVRSGRPPAQRQVAHEAITRVLDQSPRAYSYRTTAWTVPLLQRHLREGHVVSASTLRRALHGLGYRWKRPRFVLAGKDPEREGKKQALCERIRQLPPHTAVLVEDETILRELPPLRACWAKRGARAEVAITGNNARRCVFGVLNPRTAKRLFCVRYCNRAEDFRHILRAVRARYKRWSIFMILDQASSHTAKITQALLEALRIEFAWLPTACPELNPAERLWQRGKQDVCANRTYPSVDQQAGAFVEYLQSLSPEETLRCAGARSPNFWLPA